MLDSGRSHHAPSVQDAPFRPGRQDGYDGYGLETVLALMPDVALPFAVA
jgi:hypothetical protein